MIATFATEDLILQQTKLAQLAPDIQKLQLNYTGDDLIPMATLANEIIQAEQRINELMAMIATEPLSIIDQLQRAADPLGTKPLRRG